MAGAWFWQFVLVTCAAPRFQPYRMPSLKVMTCTAGVPRGSLKSQSNNAAFGASIVVPPAGAGRYTGPRGGPTSSAAACAGIQSAPTSPRQGVPLQEPPRDGGFGVAAARSATVGHSAAAAPPAGPDVVADIATAAAAAAPREPAVQPQQPETERQAAVVGAQSGQQAAQRPGARAGMRSGSARIVADAPQGKPERQTRGFAASGSSGAAPAANDRSAQGSAAPMAGAGVAHRKAAAQPRPWRGGCTAASAPAAAGGKPGDSEAVDLAKRRRQAVADVSRKNREEAAAKAGKRSRPAGGAEAGGASEVRIAAQRGQSAANGIAAEVGGVQRVAGRKRRLAAVQVPEAADGGTCSKRQRSDTAPALASRGEGDAAAAGSAWSQSAGRVPTNSRKTARHVGRQHQKRVPVQAATQPLPAAGAGAGGGARNAAADRGPSGASGAATEATRGKVVGGKRCAADTYEAGHATPSKRHCRVWR